MGARGKLNEAHLNGAFVIAGVIGLLAESWNIFLVTMAIMVVLAIFSGGIRLTPRGRGHG